MRGAVSFLLVLVLFLVLVLLALVRVVHVGELVILGVLAAECRVFAAPWWREERGMPL